MDHSTDFMLFHFISEIEFRNTQIFYYFYLLFSRIDEIAKNCTSNSRKEYLRLFIFVESRNYCNFSSNYAKMKGII